MRDRQLVGAQGASPDGHPAQVALGFHSKLAADADRMCASCFRRDMQCAADLSIRATVAKMREHFELTRSEQTVTGVAACEPLTVGPEQRWFTSSGSVNRSEEIAVAGPVREACNAHREKDCPVQQREIVRDRIL